MSDEEVQPPDRTEETKKVERQVKDAESTQQKMEASRKELERRLAQERKIR